MSWDDALRSLSDGARLDPMAATRIGGAFLGAAGGVRTCRHCGCTDDVACRPGGCSWVADDVCSACLRANLAGAEVRPDVANAWGMMWDGGARRWRRNKWFDNRDSAPAVAAYRQAIERETLRGQLAELRTAIYALRSDLRAEASRFAHNVIAHPLLVLCPPLGRWLHERTRP